METGGQLVTLPHKEIPTVIGDDTIKVVYEAGVLTVISGTNNDSCIVPTSLPLAIILDDGQPAEVRRQRLNMQVHISKTFVMLLDEGTDMRIHPVNVGHASRGLIDVKTPQLDQLARLEIVIEPLPDAAE